MVRGKALHDNPAMIKGVLFTVGMLGCFAPVTRQCNRTKNAQVRYTRNIMCLSFCYIKPLSTPNKGKPA